MYGASIKCHEFVCITAQKGGLCMRVVRLSGCIDTASVEPPVNLLLYQPSVETGGVARQCNLRSGLNTCHLSSHPLSLPLLGAILVVSCDGHHIKVLSNCGCVYLASHSSGGHSSVIRHLGTVRWAQQQALQGYTNCVCMCVATDGRVCVESHFPTFCRINVVCVPCAPGLWTLHMGRCVEHTHYRPPHSASGSQRPQR